MTMFSFLKYDHFIISHLSSPASFELGSRGGSRFGKLFGGTEDTLDGGLLRSAGVVGAERL